MRQPLVSCVLSQLQGHFPYWSAGLCVFRPERCWPEEDPKKETLLQSWGFVRPAHAPATFSVVRKYRQWTEPGDRQIPKLRGITAHLMKPGHDLVLSWQAWEGKLWWRLTTGQKHRLWLSAVPTSCGAALQRSGRWSSCLSPPCLVPGGIIPCGSPPDQT